MRGSWRRRVRAAGLAVFVFLAACAPVRRTNGVASISDLHLGDPRSVLADPAGRMALMASIETAVQRGGVRTLVLNGDVLELSLASEESAYTVARAFFTDLSGIPGLERVVLIVGNHDHRIYEELPGTPEEKLGAEFTEGAVHDALEGSLGELRLVVVYPGWMLEVKGGNVHFTHGHYFDPYTTPSFGEAETWEALEARNSDWYALLTAGGRDRTVRAVYRSIYHFGQHVSGAWGGALGKRGERHPVRLSRREEARVGKYVRQVLGDPATLAVVSGHTHDSGGLIERMAVGEREFTLYDTGGFVVGHHDKPMRPFLFLLDPERGEMRLIPIVLSEEVIAAARARAFADVP